MESGSNKSLYTLIAVVVFGIFLSLSYYLFQDQLKSVLADVLTNTSVMTSTKLAYDGLLPTDVSFFTYMVNANSTVTINTYDISGGTNVVIPSYINGYPVTNIGYKAFYKLGIDSVIFPETLKEIDEGYATENGVRTYYGAFAGNNIEKVILPDSVTRVGWGAFNSNNISELHLSESLTRLENYTFTWNNIKSVYVPNSVLSTGTSVFQGNGLENVNVSTNQYDLGYWTYADNNLTTIIIPDNITRLSEGTLRGNNLTELVIPNSVTIIMENIILNNPNLNKVTLPITFRTNVEANLKILQIDISGKQPKEINYTDTNGNIIETVIN